jgi:hypothetical protein
MKCFYVGISRMKYSVARQQCKENQLLCFHKNIQRSYILLQLHVDQQQCKWKAILRYHSFSGYTKAPQFYVILCVLFVVLCLYLVPPGKYRNSDSNHATPASFPVLSNLLFTNHPLIRNIYSELSKASLNKPRITNNNSACIAVFHLCYEALLCRVTICMQLAHTNEQERMWYYLPINQRPL